MSKNLKDLTGKLLPRRQFMSYLSKAGVLSAIGLSPIEVLSKENHQEQSAPEQKFSFLTKPYLQKPGPTEFSIMWIVNKPGYSWVEYGHDTNLNLKQHVVKHGFADAYNRINSITLANLKPNTTYNYRVASREISNHLTRPSRIIYGETIYSKTYSFTTPAENPDEVSWLMLNDIHDRPKSIPHLIGLNGSDPYDFVFFNGDMFDNSVDEQQIINSMLAPCAEVFAATKPYLMVRGNHETRGKFSRHLENYYTNKDNRYFYDFSWGPVHFLVLDTGEDKEDDHEQYGGLAAFDEYRRVQARWAEQVMQSKAFRKAKFRVVFMHIPHYYSNNWHGTNHCKELFGPLFNKYKVDMTISGHTHRFGVHKPVPGEHNYPIIIGGGPLEKQRTLIKVKASSKALSLTMLKDDGSIVGEYSLNSKS